MTYSEGKCSSGSYPLYSAIPEGIFQLKRGKTDHLELRLTERRPAESFQRLASSGHARPTRPRPPRHSTWVSFSGSSREKLMTLRPIHNWQEECNPAVLEIEPWPVTVPPSPWPEPRPWAERRGRCRGAVVRVDERQGRVPS